MQNYLNLLKNVRKNGIYRKDRTGIGVYSLFGGQTRYSLRGKIPLITTKRINIRSIIYELLWFIQGNTNIKYLKDNKVNIWNNWSDKNGDLGPIYGAQWRKWRKYKQGYVDQIDNLITEIKNNPNSRRHIVSAWNPGEIDQMALPPCHVLFQFYVTNNQELSCQLYQRSADLFLGVPFNIASYSILTSMIAQLCNLKAKEFIHTLGDMHIYSNHLKQVDLQLKRKPKNSPNIKLNPNIKNLNDFKYEDIIIENYNSYPPIQGSVAV